MPLYLLLVGTFDPFIYSLFGQIAFKCQIESPWHVMETCIFLVSIK